MFAILVVVPAAAGPEVFESRLASVEVLRAHGADDALEKLARNRRIDAVLLLGSWRESLAILAEIRDETPAPPPMFLPRPDDPDAEAPPGGRFAAGGSPESLLRHIVQELGGTPPTVDR